MQCIIIDDSLFVRETVGRLITDAGHQVIASFDEGMSFLDQFHQLKPDVIFLDIILPEITGLELLEKIRLLDPDVKVIMLSGIAQSDAISTSLRLGAIDFIQKPVSQDRLTNLLAKISDNVEPPKLEEITTIGVATTVITEFLVELIAHSTSTLRHVIEQQSSSILEEIQRKTKGMLKIDVFNLKISLDPDLWGIYTEDDILHVLKQVITDLEFELNFLYSESFINDLFSQTISTLLSKKQLSYLFEQITPNQLGLPEVSNTTELISVKTAAKSYEEFYESISISVMSVSDSGPEIIAKLNDHLLSEVEYMRNSIFFYTLVGQGENFQEGLFGPLPVTSDVPLSSLVYAAEVNNKVILLCLYFTSVAEAIVSDYNRISFLIKTRLVLLDDVSEINIAILQRILEDIINYLLEN